LIENDQLPASMEIPFSISEINMFEYTISIPELTPPSFLSNVSARNSYNLELSPITRQKELS